MNRMGRAQRRRVDVRGAGEPQVVRSPWIHLEELIEGDGNVTIGYVAPVGYAAIAADEHRMLAALVRRKGESLIELLARLDRAIDRAMNQDAYTDEING